MLNRLEAYTMDLNRIADVNGIQHSTLPSACTVPTMLFIMVS